MPKVFERLEGAKAPPKSQNGPFLLTIFAQVTFVH
jgi:hypothetical protein